MVDCLELRLLLVPAGDDVRCRCPVSLEFLRQGAGERPVVTEGRGCLVVTIDVKKAASCDGTSPKGNWVLRVELTTELSRYWKVPAYRTKYAICHAALAPAFVKTTIDTNGEYPD